MPKLVIKGVGDEPAFVIPEPKLLTIHRLTAAPVEKVEVLITYYV